MTVDADVLVVGGGPAGSVAASILARAGARVIVVDRAPAFPRFKLCGDTINPGALALLRRLRLFAGDGGGLRLQGMQVTGHTGARRGRGAAPTIVAGRYPSGLYGLAISRSELDESLLREAAAAGADVRTGVMVTAPILEAGRQRVVGIHGRAAEGAQAIRARVTIAADGRRSRLAFGLGLLRHPRAPRRWAVGAYHTDVASLPYPQGEMHVRPWGYIGVAPMPGGVVNVSVVAERPHAALRDPSAYVRTAVLSDPLLGERFAAARMAGPPAVLGPLAVETTGASVDGLVLAGDAAGFVDPMTGDGLRFAIEGAELAAAAALAALTSGWSHVHADLAHARARAFGAKVRFNRALRAFVASPAAIRGAAAVAAVAPGLVRALILRAGDCDLARAAAHDAVGLEAPLTEAPGAGSARG